MKRGHDGAEKKGRQAHYAFKALCPDSLVACLLGSRGAVKDQIQSDTRTKLVFSNKGDFYPGTGYRVLAIYADEIASIGRVFDWIVPKLVECGDVEREQPSSTAAAPDFLGKEPGEYAFRLCVSRKTSGALIGTQGAHIKALRQDTGAKVFVENDTQCDHQMVRVIGDPDALTACLHRVNEAVQAESEADYYREWAQVVNFGDLLLDADDAWSAPGFVVAPAHANVQAPTAAQVQAQYAFKALCPEQLVTCLLGARGAVKDQIQVRTGTKLVFSNRGDCYPGTGFRVLAIYADEIASLGSALEWIVPRLVECGDEERQGRAAQPEGSLLGKEPGEYVFRFCVSRRTAGAIIGTGGEHIKALRAETGAKVFVENESQCDHKMARVIGFPEAVIACLHRVNEVIQAESEADYYREWAQVVNFEGPVQDYLRSDYPDQAPAHAHANVPAAPAVQVSGHYAFKALCPEHLVTCLLGARGAVKDQIQLHTDTRLVFSNKGDFYPGTGYRVLAIYADEPASIGQALEWITQKLVACGDDERDRPSSSSGAAQPELLGKEPGEYVFRCCISRKTSGSLIGPHGAHIKALRQETGAKVFVENETQCEHQMVRVIGFPEAMMTCLHRVNEAIQAESEADYYREWTQVVNFRELMQDSMGPDYPEHPPQPPPSQRGKGRGKSEGAPTFSSRPAAPPPAARDPEPPGFPPGVPNRAAPPAASGRWPGQGGSKAREGVERVRAAVASLPEGTAQMPYNICCELPTDRVQEISGPDGEFLRSVRRSTGAEVTALEGSDGTSDVTQTLSIVGPLAHTYAAHLLLMRRLRELEPPPAGDPVGEERPEAAGGEAKPLQAQIAELLAKVKAKELEAQIAELNAQVAEAKLRNLQSKVEGKGGGRPAGQGGKSTGRKGAW